MFHFAFFVRILEVKESTWNAWTEWSPCSASCENGTSHRSRECNYLSDLDLCKGDPHEIEECSVNTRCPG